MKLLEHTSTRLVIQHNRPAMALVMGVFALMSALMEVNLIVQGVVRLPALNLMQGIAWGVWVALALLFVVVGALAFVGAWGGMVLEFDRTSEAVSLQRPRLLQQTPQCWSIYSISHIHIERNDAVKAFGLFLVLRSGERVPLATVPIYDEATARQIAQDVRQFLLMPAN